LGIGVEPTICEYVLDLGSTSTTAMASGVFRFGSKAATYASVSGAAFIAMRGDG